MTALEIVLCSVASLFLFIIVLAIIAKSVFDSYRLKKKDEYHLMATYAKTGGIVFLGDSLTEMYNVNEFFPNEQIHNRGISGNTTTEVLARLETSVFVLAPKKIFLLIGVNDLGTGASPQKVFNNIVAIIKQIKERLPSTSLYVETLLPTNKKLGLYCKIAVGRRKNKYILLINNLLREYCATNNINLIDIYPYFTDEKANLKKELTAEGLHLNIVGYQIFTDILSPYVYS